MTNKLKDALRAGVRLIGREVISPVVLAFASRPPMPELDVPVHLLVSSKTWRIGLLAILSFEYFTGRRWELYVHDDGSLDENAMRAISRKLPGARLIPRREADPVVDAMLRPFPACARSRKRHNLFLKFYDPVAFHSRERFIILDSDVFFYNRPTEIINWAEGKHQTCLYNRDSKEVYCLPRDHIKEATGVSLWDCFNSGLVCMCREAMSFDLAERLLQNIGESSWHPQFIEQTLYALCASAYGKGGPLPESYQITWNTFRKPDSVCRHYVGPAKQDHLFLEGPATLLMRMTLPSLLPQRNSRRVH